MLTKGSRISTDVDFSRDGKQVGFLRVPHSVNRSAYGWLPIPVVCFRNGEGPNVLLLSGVHGDEFEGQVILTKLCQEIAATDIRGQMIIIPAANLPATLAGERTSPLEQGEVGNLNRVFPGDPYGGPTAMIAHYIETILLSMSDFVFDLHSGGTSLMLLPSAYMKKSNDDERTRRTIELMKVWGAPFTFVDLVDTDETLSGAARRCRTIHLGTELGGGGTVRRDALTMGQEGLRRVLQYIGSLTTDGTQGEPRGTRLVTVGGADYYVYSDEDGVFEPLVELGDEVSEGQPAGAIHFPESPWRKANVAYFSRSGLVFCKRVPGRTKRGDCLFHLAADFKMTSRGANSKES